MDDSVRAEYQRRLAEGDQGGALAYLRMLRTQAQDPGERNAYDQAIAGIEGGASTAAGAVDSSYGGSTGPFGDDAAGWDAAHPPRPAATGSGQGGWTPAPSAGGSSGSFGDAPSPPPSYGGTPGYPGTSAGVPGQQHPAQGGLAGLGGALGNVGETIGGRFQHAFENVTGGGQQHPQASHPAPPPEAAANPQNPAEFIGGRIEHAFDNVTGRGTPHPTANQHVQGEKTSSEGGGDAEGTPL